MLARRAESVSTGIDESVQLFGGDPFGRNAQLGLRIPAFVPPASGGLGRYLFALSRLEVPRGKTAHIRGYRQLVTLGARLTIGGLPRVVEQEILSPTWHPPDGDISWHLQDIGPPNGGGPSFAEGQPGSPLNRDNFAFRTTVGPALLYETATLATPYYVQLTGYTPPNAGKPWGRPLIDGGFETLYDLRTTWRTSQAWDSSFDYLVTGPRVVVLYASVRQTNPSVETGRVALTTAPPVSMVEETFLFAYPTANYWRVAGSLVVDS
jgi:hypothetical protein